MSNVYIKTKIRSGSYAMEYLRKIRKKGSWWFVISSLRRAEQSATY